MFVKPRSAFVGCPSVVCSSSGSAKNPRYARLFPSTRKSSASRAGPSSRTSSSPVSVFGTPQLYGPTTGRRRDGPRPRSGRLQGSFARPGTSTRRFLDLRKTQPVRRVPILSGSRIVHVPIGDEDVVVHPPAPPSRVVDVEAAVRDALRFPLSGAPLTGLVPKGGRVTVLVEPAALPLPGAQIDPRPEALAT